MAGSLGHLITDPDARAGVGDGTWSLIENMGDAHECVEELLWLVLRAIGDREAFRLLHAEFYPMARGEMPEDAHMDRVGRVMTGTEEPKK